MAVYNPEDSHLHTHSRENLKSYLNRRPVLLFLFCPKLEAEASFPDVNFIV
jgi:hypothetical protein